MVHRQRHKEYSTRGKDGTTRRKRIETTNDEREKINREPTNGLAIAGHEKEFFVRPTGARQRIKKPAAAAAAPTSTGVALSLSRQGRQGPH